jgi:hypothetical protein
MSRRNGLDFSVRENNNISEYIYSFPMIATNSVPQNNRNVLCHVSCVKRPTSVPLGQQESADCPPSGGLCLWFLHSGNITFSYSYQISLCPSLIWTLVTAYTTMQIIPEQQLYFKVLNLIRLANFFPYLLQIPGIRKLIPGICGPSLNIPHIPQYDDSVR